MIAAGACGRSDMTITTAWLWLALAIVLEVSGTMCLKWSVGFTRWLPSVLIIVFYGGSFAALVMALKRIELGVAYAIWSAIGTALIVILGVFLFKESATLIKFSGIVLIIAGVVLLHLSGESA